jgi:hypothetical protein
LRKSLNLGHDATCHDVNGWRRLENATLAFPMQELLTAKAEGAVWGFGHQKSAVVTTASGHDAAFGWQGV